MKTIEWSKNKLKMIDQTLLPHKLKFLYLSNVSQVVKAIKTMQVRGAPAIGVAAAFGCVLGYRNLKRSAEKLVKSRPTAVNLKWAVDQMLTVAKANKGLPPKKLKELLLKVAKKMADDDIKINKRMGEYGSSLIKNGMTVMTICNAGALATVDWGTALGVVRSAKKNGKKFDVLASETRPRLQGARLTAWELKHMKIPFALITDNMAGYLMSQKKIDLVITGADRIALNGDSANKIGTYSLAILAKEHGISFYIAAPISTIDFNIRSGKHIPIEERDQKEVLEIFGPAGSGAGIKIAPSGIKALNPAFDVTPAKYIKGIITEKGILKPSQIKNLK